MICQITVWIRKIRKIRKICKIRKNYDSILKIKFYFQGHVCYSRHFGVIGKSLQRGRTRHHLYPNKAVHQSNVEDHENQAEHGQSAGHEVGFS